MTQAPQKLRVREGASGVDSTSNGRGRRREKMTAKALRRNAALATAISAATACLLVSAHSAWADNVTLNDGDTQTYTPAPVQTGNGVSHRTIGAQPTTLNNSTEVNYNATSNAPTTSNQ